MLDLIDERDVDLMPVTVESLKTRFEEDKYPVYKDFVQFFVSGVVGIRLFDKQKCMARYSTYVTVSDEAFAVLTLENNSSRWASMAELDEWKDSHVSSKWTTSREKRKTQTEGHNNNSDKENENKADKSEARSYRGWSAQGIARYNQLFQEIKWQRQTPEFQVFETYLMNMFQEEEEEEGQNRNKQQKIDNKKSLPVAQHELWTDEEKEKLNKKASRSIKLPFGMEELGESAGV
jgi:hypothetical protein